MPAGESRTITIHLNYQQEHQPIAEYFYQILLKLTDEAQFQNVCRSITRSEPLVLFHLPPGENREEE